MATTGHRPRRVPTLRVATDGALKAEIGPGGFMAGFSELFDLSPTAFMPQPLAAEEITRTGFARTGAALARVLAAARDRFGD